LVARRGREWCSITWTFAEEFEMACVWAACYASAVYPATGNLHDEIGVLGVSSTTGRASAPPNCLNSAAFPSIAVVVVVVVVVGNFMK